MHSYELAHLHLGILEQVADILLGAAHVLVQNLRPCTVPISTAVIAFVTHAQSQFIYQHTVDNLWFDGIEHLADLAGHQCLARARGPIQQDT